MALARLRRLDWAVSIEQSLLASTSIIFKWTDLFISYPVWSICVENGNIWADSQKIETSLLQSNYMLHSIVRQFVLYTYLHIIHLYVNCFLKMQSITLQVFTKRRFSVFIVIQLKYIIETIITLHIVTHRSLSATILNHNSFIF